MNDQVNQSQPLATERNETLRAAQGDGQSCVVGRELDAAMAEHVMGWQAITGYHSSAFGNSTVFCLWGYPGNLAIYRNGRTKGAAERWSPSTDIVAAMEVLDKADGMWELMRCVEREVLDDESTPFVSRYRCSLRFGDNLGHASGCATAPEAICRAALAAVALKTPEAGRGDNNG